MGCNMSMFHTTKRITSIDIRNGSAPDWDIQWLPDYGTCFIHKYGGIEPVKWDTTTLKNNPFCYIDITVKRA